jgi:hypothetical protein
MDTIVSEFAEGLSKLNDEDFDQDGNFAKALRGTSDDFKNYLDSLELGLEDT